MARTKLADLTPSDAVGIDNDHALAEVEREINVRLRCFDRWVEDGRMSYVEAKDRLTRLMAAHAALAAVTSSGDMTDTA